MCDVVVGPADSPESVGRSERREDCDSFLPQRSRLCSTRISCCHTAPSAVMGDNLVCPPTAREDSDGPYMIARRSSASAVRSGRGR